MKVGFTRVVRRIREVYVDFKNAEWDYKYHEGWYRFEPWYAVTDGESIWIFIRAHEDFILEDDLVEGKKFMYKLERFLGE